MNVLDEIDTWKGLVGCLRVVRDDADRAVAILEGRLDASDEALRVHAYLATQYAYYERRLGTFEELTSTGSLGLIEDEALRNTAMPYVRFESVDKAFEEGADSPWRSLFRSVLPVDVQDALTARCGDRIVDGDGLRRSQLTLDHECDAGLPAAQAAAAAAALRADPEVLRTLRLRAMNLRSSISDLTDNATDLTDAVEAVIGASP